MNTKTKDVPKQTIKLPIGTEEVKKAMELLKKYKTGKTSLDDRIVRNDKWWKMRHWEIIETEKNQDDPKPSSGWLFNTVISKHADYMDSYPTSDILPREKNDTEEAHRLSSIIPVIMEQNSYKNVYSEEAWYKLKNGTGVYGIFWDKNKLHGLGDIKIEMIDILNIFWEPGIKDIQKSQNFFYVELVDNKLLEASYPQIKEELRSTQDQLIKKYWYDDTVDTAGKSAVIDWYYKKIVNGKQTLQYCKFVNEIVLYATENDTEVPMKREEQPLLDENGMEMIGADGLPIMQTIEVPSGLSMAERGLYDHALYPFVFDALFPEAGMPIGFGFIDVCKHAQASIDIYNNAFEKNVQFVASPRYMMRDDGGINEEEFSNPNEMIVHCSGDLGEDSYRPIETPTFINSNYIRIIENKINEMKETSGNRDANTGGTTAGVTAASAIAAMQEAAGKTSRDQIAHSYEAHKQVVSLIIELIRQFYSMPRQFRITGTQGKIEFAQYTNTGLQPKHQGNEYGVDMGYRLPMFDVTVKVEKDNAYSRMSQNELAIQFYNLGFFNPQQADQSIAALEMMEFEGRDKVMNSIRQNGGMYQKMLQMQQQMLQLAQIVDQLKGTDLALTMAEAINEEIGTPNDGSAQVSIADPNKNNIVERAKAKTQETTRPR